MHFTFTGQKYTNFNYLQNILLYFFVVNVNIGRNNVLISLQKHLFIGIL